MKEDKVPIVGSDGKTHHVQDDQIAKQNTSAIDSQLVDLETSKATASDVIKAITDLKELTARVYSVEALMSDLQTSHANKQNQITTSGIVDPSGDYDQSLMQDTVTLVNEIRLTVNRMNI